MGETLYFGPFRLERESKELYRGSSRVEIPLRAVALLDHLVARPGELSSKEELLQAVWGATHVTQSSLTEAVSRLRSALGDSATQPRYIETLAGRGYRFVARVHPGRTRRARGVLTVLAAGWIGLALAAGILWNALGPTGETSAGTLIVELAGDGRLLDTVDLPPLSLRGLTPSPDGSRLAFSVGERGEAEIWLFDRDTRALERISEGGDNAEVVWSPDGEWLAWGAKRGESWNVVRRRVDGHGGVEEMVAGPGDEFPEAWSAGGSRLVYSQANAAGDYDLYLLRRTRDGWSSHPLVTTDSHEYLGALSPDGRHLAYVSDLGGKWHVYVSDLEDARPAVRVGRGEDPFWSADGSELYFLAGGQLASATWHGDRLDVGLGLPGFENILRARNSGRGGFIAAVTREG